MGMAEVETAEVELEEAVAGRGGVMGVTGRAVEGETEVVREEAREGETGERAKREDWEGREKEEGACNQEGWVGQAEGRGELEGLG